MHLVQITPGAGGMYCGNCFRDNALVAALRRQGHETLMVPLYLPMTLDEDSTVEGTPTFFGGINVYLEQHSAFFRRAPRWLHRLLASPRLLRWAAGRAAKTRAEDVGDLNVSMLRGEEGNQARELEELIGWLRLQSPPDVVFLSNALLVGFTRRLQDALGTRVVVFLQSEESFLDSIPEPWRTQSWETLAERGREVDAWIAPTRYFADRMSERLGLDPARVHVVPNGIRLEGYDTLVRPDLPQPVMGYFARMCPEKGLDVVIDAFIELKRRRTLPGLRLRVGGGCGPGDEAFVARQKNKLAGAGILADASFHPNLTREEKLKFYASCDVISVPARQSEAFGLYVIESLAAGTPLVQPDFATFPELLADTGGGVLCGPNNASALAAALEPLLRDRDRLRALGEAGRRAVRERYTDGTMARQVAAVAERVRATGPGRAAPADGSTPPIPNPSRG